MSKRFKFPMRKHDFHDALRYPVSLFKPTKEVLILQYRFVGVLFFERAKLNLTQNSGRKLYPCRAEYHRAAPTSHVSRDDAARCLCVTSIRSPTYYTRWAKPVALNGTILLTPWQHLLNSQKSVLIRRHLFLLSCSKSVLI